MNNFSSDHNVIPPDPLHPRENTQFSFRHPLPQFRVVLLNNIDKELMFVVRTVMELTRFCRTEATHKMWQAHYEGRSLLIVTHKERAELFVELFANRGVTVALEPS